MVDDIKLAAESRTEFGKGAARRIRRAGKVPAVMYAGGEAPAHISLPGHETLLALRTANALLSVSVDGGEPQLALPKQVARHPLTGLLEHVDLITVKKGERVVVEVPIIITGDEHSDRIINLDLNSLTVEAEATSIPDDFTIDVFNLEIGDQLLANQLEYPAGVTYAGAAEDDLILSVVAAKTEEELEAELAGGDDDAEVEVADAADADDADEE